MSSAGGGGVPKYYTWQIAFLLIARLGVIFLQGPLSNQFEKFYFVLL